MLAWLIHIIDVTVVHPLTQNRVTGSRDTDTAADTADRTAMPATDQIEKLKRQKYKKLIADHDALFSTAAVETTGGLGKEFRELLKDVAHEAQTNVSGWELGDIMTGMRSAVAVAIQIGNARLIKDNRNRILKKHLYYIRQEERLRSAPSTRRKTQNRGTGRQSLGTQQIPTIIDRPLTDLLPPPSFSVSSMC